MSGAGEVQLVRGGHNLVLVAFPAIWLAVELEDTDGDPRTAEHPETLRQVLARFPTAMCAMDGPMFESSGSYSTYSSARLAYRYLDRARNLDVRSRFSSRGATLSRGADGRLVVLDGDAIPEGATWAVQGFPALVRDGRNVSNPARDADRNGRAALCALAGGRVAFAVSRSGMHELAVELLALRDVRVVDAVYTDGGGSTGLAVRAADGSTVTAVGLDSRRLPVYLLALPPAGEVHAPVVAAGEAARSLFGGVGVAFARSAVSGLGRALKIVAGVTGVAVVGAVTTAAVQHVLQRARERRETAEAGEVAGGG